MSRTIVLTVVAAAPLALGVGQAPAHSDPTAVENLAPARSGSSATGMGRRSRTWAGW
jgi:hypothetical protein